ncbi:hypothetical protein B0H11DRAFT_2229586 [Mycena galericulata]|nr:hypothetical protein B0H11DRAFT_2229586 [Mycena galericulata]
MASTEFEVQVPFFNKGKSHPTTGRKRTYHPRASANLLSAGTKRTTSQHDGYDDPDAPDVKWTAEGSHVNATLDITSGDEAQEIRLLKNKPESTIPTRTRLKTSHVRALSARNITPIPS